VAEQVGGDHGEAFGEVGEGALPVPPRPGDAVDQHERRAVARLAEADAVPVEDDLLALGERLHGFVIHG
jgi:hypothetical protein